MSVSVSGFSARTRQRGRSTLVTSRGVLRRRADERHRPVSHNRQQGVLLGLGAAVELIDE
jgi:hypothetical protein